MYQPFEKLLLTLTSGHSPSAFIARFVPPEYLYARGTNRQVTRHGINFSLDISLVVDHFIYFDFKDAAFENLMRTVNEDFVIVDVGANIGRFALYFAKHAHKGKVICFEPDSENFSCLRDNVKLNDFHNIKLTMEGLGSTKRKLNLYKVNENNPGMNRILKNASLDWNQFEEIDIIRLDEHLEMLDLEIINLIKIDVEGFEYEVLRGGEELINKFKPILFVEVNEQSLRESDSSAYELLEWIKSKGYSIVDAKSMKSLPNEGFKFQTDIMCIPEMSVRFEG